MRTGEVPTDCFLDGDRSLEPDQAVRSLPGHSFIVVSRLRALLKLLFALPLLLP